MNNIVITSAKKYIDIDAYAACIAYSILLKSSNIKAKPVTTSLFNESIPEIIKNIDLGFEKYTPNENDKFIILDVSNPDMFDNIVKQKDIIEIIDHHIGFEEYWKQKELVKDEIEFIGSVCTIIYERFVQSNKIELLTTDLCKLLTAGILDNTLNLKADITTSRDILAYNELIKLGKLDSNWAKEYFEECEKTIIMDLEKAIINDMKDEYISDNLPNAFGQLTIYHSKNILEQIDLIKKVFNKYEEWMINIISVEDGKSYIIAESKKTKSDLEQLFNKKFDKDILVLDKFMLRKEIIKKACI